MTSRSYLFSSFWSREPEKGILCCEPRGQDRGSGSNYLRHRI
ncbi:MAG TPA: hypothetical protein VMV49_01790 [Candidatus Deferrimicrobium sp.]|nr:hypothetical protein [Candidatus Deferrimicrobium sp.]